MARRPRRNPGRVEPEDSLHPCHQYATHACFFSLNAIIITRNVTTCIHSHPAWIHMQGAPVSGALPPVPLHTTAPLVARSPPRGSWDMRRLLHLPLGTLLPLLATAPALPLAPLTPISWTEALGAEGLPGLVEDPAFASPAARRALLDGIGHSLAYLRTATARKAYERLGGEPVRLRVRASLERLDTLLREAPDREALLAGLRRDFRAYRMDGAAGDGVLHITGYFEGAAEASLTRTRTFRWPLYRRPADLDQWPTPHPTRAQLEGRDGQQGGRGRLKGLELAWLKDRLEAYLIQVQGSARLTLPDGRVMTVGFAGRTDHPYVSIGQELEADLQRREGRRTLQGVLAHFRAQPELLDTYIPRNNRFVFFTETEGRPATGALGVPVTGGRSIATDRRLFPPGAPVLVTAEIPADPADPTPPRPWSRRLMLDQDAGGAILGPGRIDMFMGGGPEGRALAGGINGPGRACYLLLKEAPTP